MTSNSNSQDSSNSPENQEQTSSKRERKGMSRQEAGRKGGQVVSQDREHMARIGRKGGQTVSKDREHMARIGRKGGQHSHGGGRKSKVEKSDQEAA